MNTISAYVEKAVPLKGADEISIMLTAPKSMWPEVSRLVMQDVVIGLASEQEQADPAAPVDVIGRIRFIQEQFDGVKADILTIKRDAEVPRPCGATPPSVTIEKTGYASMIVSEQPSGELSLEPIDQPMAP